MKQKLYESAAWLREKYINQNMHIDEIAKICGVTPLTIRRKLKEFNLIP